MTGTQTVGLTDAGPPPALQALLQPVGGLFSMATRILPHAGEPQFCTRVVRVRDLARMGALPPGVTAAAARPISGAGTAIGDAHALMLALAEGVERYSGFVFNPQQFLLASAAELGDAALDLESIPRCSIRELADPLCPLIAPDPRAPMRWVQAISLLDGKTMYVPAVMAYMSVGFSTPGERIALPISTGCAAHTSYEGALWRGILEVVERDALTVLWLQQLALPRIVVDDVQESLEPCWARYLRGTRDLDYHFFDATSELGIPTIYGVQRARYDARATTLVTCSTDVTPAGALAKVVRDMCAGRLASRTDQKVPERWEDFRDLQDGPTYMGRREQAGAFDFLIDTPRRVALSEMSSVPGANDRDILAAVLQRFREGQMSVYAVDISCDEALRSGVKVVRAIVPGLMPLTFNYRARYLGHPRLYELPARLGLPVRDEANLNRFPQPFG